ncbi:MAG: hypothetical protein QXS93_04405 [Candidatus Micrarchaeia archaeon]
MVGALGTKRKEEEINKQIENAYALNRLQESIAGNQAKNLTEQGKLLCNLLKITTNNKEEGKTLDKVPKKINERGLA